MESSSEWNEQSANQSFMSKGGGSKPLQHNDDIDF
jgi:hypothetical protein